jgi:hypothetical protein
VFVARDSAGSLGEGVDQQHLAEGDGGLPT